MTQSLAESELLGFKKRQERGGVRLALITNCIKYFMQLDILVCLVAG